MAKTSTAVPAPKGYKFTPAPMVALPKMPKTSARATAKTPKIGRALSPGAAASIRATAYKLGK